MPELPEVETVRRGMEKAVCGRVVARVLTHREGLRVPFPKGLKKALEGARIDRLSRRAKYILVHLDNGHIVILHLGMSGRILLVPPGQAHEPKKHDHFVLAFDDGSQLIFNDPRRFGMVLLSNEKDLAGEKALRDLGPEPLDNEFSGPVLAAALAGKKTSIKAALMDQRVVAGLGNIYVCEALFESRIQPTRIAADVSAAEAEDLVRAIRLVLDKALAAGGSTLRDYRHANGDLGYFQHQFAVYDRAGKACPGCRCDISKTGGVQQITQGGRSTYFCPVKQV